MNKIAVSIASGEAGRIKLLKAALEGDNRFLKLHDQRWCARFAPHLQQKHADATFAVVDLETTGSVIGVDEIMELGVVTVRRGRLSRSAREGRA